MPLLLIITVPVCIELAAWAVDATLETRLLKLWKVSEVDDHQ